MQNKEITIVVQGPIHDGAGNKKPEITTKKCIESIRTHLPGAFIILSTWKNMNADRFDCDLLIENADPGQNVIIHPFYSDRIVNENRQIKSTLEGLKRVETKYAMKLRSDNYLLNADFKQIFDRFPHRTEKFKILDKRVVACNIYCREIQKGRVVTFQPCDFFHFGLTEDLLKIWDIPYFPKERETKLKKWQHRLSTEQYLWLSFIEKYNGEISINHLFDSGRGNIEKSQISLINNLIIAEPERIGLGVSSRFDLPLKISCTFISFMRWKVLYRKYCRNDFVIPGRVKFSTQLALTRFWFYWRKILSCRISDFYKNE